MAVKEKLVLTLLAGIGTAMGLYYFLRRRRTTEDGSNHSTSEPARDPLKIPNRQKLDRIIEIQGRVSFTSNEDIESLDDLVEMVAVLTKDELEELRENADCTSFQVSEWVFYHTLRSKKEIHWDCKTGLIDEGLSPQEREFSRRIADTMRKAYWDKHIEDLNLDPPDYKHLIARLTELQERVNSYQKPIRREIFDIVLIQQAIETGTFDRSFFLSILKRVVAALYDLESPAAHEETVRWHSLKQTTKSATTRSEFHSEVIESLQFLFAQLDLLDAEMAQYKSSQMALETKRKNERDSFRNLLSGKKVLPGTILREVLSVVDTESIASINKSILNRFKELILGYLFDMDQNRLPESLYPDSKVLSNLKNKLDKIQRLACILVAIHAQLGSTKQGKAFLSQPTEKVMMFAEGFGKIVLENSATNKELVDEAASHVMRFTNEPCTDSQLTALLRSVDQCTSSNSPVKQLYTKRVRELVQTGIDQANPQVASSALGSSPFFLSICAKETRGVIKGIIEFLAEHLNVYLPIYRDIVNSNL